MFPKSSGVSPVAKSAAVLPCILNLAPTISGAEDRACKDQTQFVLRRNVPTAQR